MNTKELESIARAMVAPGRGILAADESTGTIKKRFDAIGIALTEENRRAYRDMLFTTPGAAKFISGVIMYDETLRQKSADGTPFPALLQKQGIVPGIKVDAGAKPLAGFKGETVTEGLDGLRERLAEYHKLGARFAKWRAVIDIADGIPSRFAIDANAHALARYAALCQEAGIVPIVEPEVLMDGAHTLERCDEVTSATLQSVFDALFAHRVHLEGIVLKPNMVIAGKKCPKQATARAGGGGDRALPEASCAVSGTGHSLPFRRPERGRGDRAPQPDECPRAAAVGADVQLRQGTAGDVACHLGRQGGQCRAGAEGVPQARPPERPRAQRRLQARHGEGGGLRPLPARCP